MNQQYQYLDPNQRGVEVIVIPAGSISPCYEMANLQSVAGSLKLDKTAYKEGESIIFSGTWPVKNDYIHIHYGAEGWGSWVATLQSDANGNFVGVGILPIGTVTGTTQLTFSGCSTSSIGYMCSVYGGYRTPNVTVSVSPGTHIPAEPGPFNKIYPASSSYSGPAVTEYVAIDTNRVFILPLKFLPSIENVIFMAIQSIETAAIQAGTKMLELHVTSYTSGLLSYHIEISYTHDNPVKTASVGDMTIKSMIAPLLIYAAALAFLFIIVYFTVEPLLKSFDEILYGPTGGGGISGFIGIALVLGAGYLLLTGLSKAAPAIKEITGSVRGA